MEATIDYQESLFLTQKIVNWLILAIFIVTNLGVLIYLKFKIDNLGKLLILLHLVVCFVRLLAPSSSDGFYVDGGMFYYQLSFLAYTLILISIYIFTFELWLVKKALSNEEVRRKNVY